MEMTKVHQPTMSVLKKTPQAATLGSHDGPPLLIGMQKGLQPQVLKRGDMTKDNEEIEEGTHIYSPSGTKVSNNIQMARGHQILGRPPT